jgi:large subunit ribosomal protein L9
MKVVLLDDLSNLGEAGTVVTVKDGYARNYLIPRRLAELATRDAVNRISLIRRAAEAKRIRRRTEAADKFGLLAGKSITLTFKAGTQSRLFGAVTSQLIADEVKKQIGVELERRHIMLEEPIKHLGEYTVPLRASADVTGEIKVLVQPEGPRGVIGGPGGRRAALAALQAQALNQKGPESAPVAEAAPPAEAEPAEAEPAADETEDSAEKYEDVEQTHDG